MDERISFSWFLVVGENVNYLSCDIHLQCLWNLPNRWGHVIIQVYLFYLYFSYCLSFDSYHSWCWLYCILLVNTELLHCPLNLIIKYIYYVYIYVVYKSVQISILIMINALQKGHNFVISLLFREDNRRDQQEQPRCLYCHGSS